MSVNMNVYIITLCVIMCALLLALRNYINIKKPKTHSTSEEDAMFALSKELR